MVNLCHVTTGTIGQNTCVLTRPNGTTDQLSCRDIQRYSLRRCRRSHDGLINRRMRSGRLRSCLRLRSRRCQRMAMPNKIPKLKIPAYISDARGEIAIFSNNKSMTMIVTQKLLERYGATQVYICQWGGVR